MLLRKRGFTLLEMLIVVIIIGILVAIALPQYINTLERARAGEAVTNIGSISASLDRYWYEKGALPTDDDYTYLDIEDPNSQTERLWNYYFVDTGTTATVRKYTITAYRNRNDTEDTSYMVKWTQSTNETGKLTKTANLGGPTS